MNLRVPSRTTTAVVLLFAGLLAITAMAQNGGSEPQPAGHIGVMERHGLAGIVTSAGTSRIVMEIPENVEITVEAGPSTRIVDLGQDATTAAIHTGDAIFASGDLNEETRTLRAQVITIQSSQAAMVLRIRHDRFGKAWTAGVITAVQGESITVKRMDGQSQTFSVDQGTAYRLHDQQGSFDMVRPGERITAQLRTGQAVAAQVLIAGMTRTN